MSQHFDKETLQKIIEEIHQRQGLLDYAKNECGLEVKYCGSGRYTCPCPIHGGTRPNSFYISTRGKNENWVCYGKCGRKFGDIFDFVMLLHNNHNPSNKPLRRMDVINSFAKKFGIHYEITDEDIADRLHSEYLRTVKSSFKEDDNLQSINYQVSKTVRNIVTKNPLRRLEKYSEIIYESLDEGIIDCWTAGDNEREKYKAKKNLDLIQEKIIPSFENFSKKLLDQQSILNSIITQNKSCSSCYLKYNTKHIMTGKGDFSSGVIVLDFSPSKNEDNNNTSFDKDSYKFIDIALEQRNLSRRDIWMDYAVHCSTDSFIEKESKTCRKLWIERIIDLIKPKGIFVLGESAARALTGNMNISMNMQNKINLFGAEIWISKHTDDIFEIEKDGFISYFGSFLDKFIDM